MNVFDRAIEVIEGRGWRRFSTDDPLYAGKGQVCIGIAVSIAIDESIDIGESIGGSPLKGRPWNEPFLLECSSVLRLVTGAVNIPRYNDEVIANQDEAIEVLRQASKEWDNQHPGKP